MPGQKREARLRARCAGHPRLENRLCKQDVDGRVKPGHDGALGMATMDEIWRRVKAERMLEIRQSIQFARITAFAAGWATRASPSSLCCSRGIEKQTLKPSTVRSVTMPWVGSDDCSTTQDASG